MSILKILQAGAYEKPKRFVTVLPAAVGEPEMKVEVEYITEDEHEEMVKAIPESGKISEHPEIKTALLRRAMRPKKWEGVTKGNVMRLGEAFMLAGDALPIQNGHLDCTEEWVEALAQHMDYVRFLNLYAAARDMEQFAQEKIRLQKKESTSTSDSVSTE